MAGVNAQFVGVRASRLSATEIARAVGGAPETTDPGRHP
jgi:hypothetical protein